jgi:hypothetical protein
MGLAALQSWWRLVIPIGSPLTLAGIARRRWTGEGPETAYTSTGLLTDHHISVSLPFARGEPGELPKLRGERCFRSVFELRRLYAEAARVDSSGARDHNARCAWLGASGRRRSSSRRYPRQLFCVGLVGFPVRARAGTAARMNPLQLESGRLGAWIGAKTNVGCIAQYLSLCVRVLNEGVSIPGHDSRRHPMKLLRAG